MTDRTLDLAPPDIAPQWRVIDRARAVLAADDRILAGWLAGSFGCGAADSYSDIDLHCLVRADCVVPWRELAAEVAGPLVLASDLPGMIGGYALTPEWLHLDLIVHPRSSIELRGLTGILPLYDSTGELPEVPAAQPGPGEPYFPSDVVQFFFYLLGNLVATFGRGELIVAYGGILAVRDRLVELMVAERGIRRTSGNKRLNVFLTEEQREFLESMPAADVSIDRISAAIRHISAEFIRRGRALAVRSGQVWPQSLEDATIDHLRRHLGIDFREA